MPVALTTDSLRRHYRRGIAIFNGFFLGACHASFVAPGPVVVADVGRRPCRRRPGRRPACTKCGACADRDHEDPRAGHSGQTARRGARHRGHSRHAEGRPGDRRPSRPRTDVDEECRWQLVATGVRQADWRQHRLPGRRAVVRRGAGVPQRPQPGQHRQRQVHPWRRCRRGRRPGRAQRRCGYRWSAQGRNLVMVACPWPVRRGCAGRCGPADRRCRRPQCLWRWRDPAHDFRGPHQRTPVHRCDRLPRPAGKGHLHRARQSRHRCRRR